MPGFQWAAGRVFELKVLAGVWFIFRLSVTRLTTAILTSDICEPVTPRIASCIPRCISLNYCMKVRRLGVMESQLPIILVSHHRTQTQREMELQQARIRSHTARMSHPRRRFPETPGRMSRRKLDASPCKWKDLSRCSTHQSLGATATLWQERSLLKRDPFASYVGHSIQAIGHEVLDYSRLSDNLHCLANYFVWIKLI